MTIQQQFGGEWTQDKLERLDGYLKAYMTILKNYPYLQTVYVDAFAGTGERRTASKSQQLLAPINGTSEDVFQIQNVLKGNARIALDIVPPFGRYIFIERSKKKCIELEKLKTEYQHLSSRVQVEKADASAFLTTWCEETDWTKTRAVVFLDPFGMQVEWSLLEAIANTKSIDLWLLVPIGMGVNRLMTQKDLPKDIWAQRLTKFFGTDDWQNEHYKPRVQPDLFGESSAVEKDTSNARLEDYFVNRLSEVFPGVAKNPLTLRNSRNSPMFLLCFVTANPKKSVRDAALRIAQHLLKE